MIRRRRQRGTLELRAGRWCLRVRNEQVDQTTGEVRRPRIRVDLGSELELRSDAAARRAADAWLARRIPDALTAGPSILFAAYCERFLDVEAALFRASSQRRYRTAIRRHLVPAFGSLPLERIDQAAAKAFLARLKAAGLKRATVAGLRGVLLHVLRQARADGFDAPTIDGRALRLPTDDTAPREPRHLTADEVRQILVASAFPWRALWALLGFLGLRISEALGVAWHHLELGASPPVVHVRQSSSLGELLPLKTRTSRADLPLPPELVAILTEYRARWRPNAAGLLFATRRGTPLRADNVRRRELYPLLARLGLPRAGAHAFRHGLPARLFAAGASPEAVRRVMRHGSLAMTARYSHVDAADLAAALDAAAARASRKDSQP